MWHLVGTTQSGAPALGDTALQLIRTTSRTMIATTLGIYIAWHYLATLILAPSMVWSIWLISLLVLLLWIGALRLLRHNLLAAQVVWQLGFVAAVTIAVISFGRLEIAFLYALLPLVAVVTIGWQAGLIAEALIGGLLWWLGSAGILPALSAPTAGAILAGGAVCGLLGWSVTHSLIHVSQWSIASFAQAEQHLAVVQQQRARLDQLVKDLNHAYYRLERANTALVVARKEAEAAERFRAEFVTNVSHELRTPLNLIIGFSEVMTGAPESYGGVELPGAYRSDLHAIARSAQHLLALVDDVLDLARIEVGRIALHREQVDLAGLIGEAADTVREFVLAKGLALHITIDDDLAPLWLDRARIRQVLLNLLVNAARFTERGSVSIAVEQAVDEVVVRIADTGPGIPQPDLAKVFEEFRSTELPVSTWHSGTGLGLPISKKFVELHHGRMGVESVAGEGASFWFTLPSAPVAPAPRATPARWRPYVPLGSSDRIIVVVHDDERIAGLLARYLDGYRIVCATSAAAGVALAAELQAIALLADSSQTLPDGRIATLVIQCPLPSGRRMSLALGANDLLVKPVARADLLAAIERLERPVRRVLIVDDDPDVVRLLRRMLRTRIAPQDCLTAHGGAEALAVLRETQVDLVLLDLAMPEVNGQAVLEQIAADAQLAQLAVIVVSAKGHDYLAEQLQGSIQINQPAGFQLGEVTQAVDALLGALSPGWTQLGSGEPESEAAPPA